MVINRPTVGPPLFFNDNEPKEQISKLLHHKRQLLATMMDDHRVYLATHDAKVEMIRDDIDRLEKYHNINNKGATIK